MTLAEYRTEVEKLERGDYAGTQEALCVASGVLAREIETAAWKREFRAEAAKLAQRARAVQASLLDYA